MNCFKFCLKKAKKRAKMIIKYKKLIKYTKNHGVCIFPVYKKI